MTGIYVSGALMAFAMAIFLIIGMHLIP